MSTAVLLLVCAAIGWMLVLDTIRWRWARAAERAHQRYDEQYAEAVERARRIEAGMADAFFRLYDREERKARMREAVEAARKRPRGWPECVLLNMPWDEFIETLPAQLTREGREIMERERFGGTYGV